MIWQILIMAYLGIGFGVGLVISILDPFSKPSVVERIAMVVTCMLVWPVLFLHF